MTGIACTDPPPEPADAFEAYLSATVMTLVAGAVGINRRLVLTSQGAPAVRAFSLGGNHSRAFEVNIGGMLAVVDVRLVVCPHCNGAAIDAGATGLHACVACDGLFRSFPEDVHVIPIDLAGVTGVNPGEIARGYLRAASSDDEEERIPRAFDPDTR